jgi:hypothetical protein
MVAESEACGWWHVVAGAPGGSRMKVRVQSDLGDFSSTVIEEVKGR